MLKKQEKRYRRHKRVRAKIFGTAKIPRLCVFRSARHIYAQLINDEKGETILNSNDFEIKKPKVQTKSKESKEKKERSTKAAIAYEVGKLIAGRALKKEIKKIVFDRGGYGYYGRTKALAEGAREGGLEF